MNLIVALTPDEYQQVVTDAADDINISAYVRRKLNLPQQTVFQEYLNAALVKALALKEGTTFQLSALYTPIEWREIKKKISTPLLGRRFFDIISQHPQIEYIGLQNRVATYKRK
jgi:hypothetical protein